MIKLKNVVKQYDDGTRAVDGISFTAPAGKVTVLVGPSGCGKTTTLRMINRLTEPSSGQIFLGETDTQTIDTIVLRRQIGYVIQAAGLFPHRSVIDNVMTTPLLKKTSRKEKREIRSRAQELLELVGIDLELAKKYPWQLSGGQQQRVGVARALASNPPYMLLDEPFSAVDPLVRKQLQDEFLAIQEKLSKTIIMVTHDIEEALKMGDQIIVFGKGGKIAQAGSPTEIMGNPANDFVAEFVAGAQNLTLNNADSLKLEQATQNTEATKAILVDSAGNYISSVDLTEK